VKVVLDENIPGQLRVHLSHHETVSAVYAGFGGLKNGNLLAAAEAAEFQFWSRLTKRFNTSRT
jgi:hypothetical protein